MQQGKVWIQSSQLKGVCPASAQFDVRNTSLDGGCRDADDDVFNPTSSHSQAIEGAQRVLAIGIQGMPKRPPLIDLLLKRGHRSNSNLIGPSLGR
eukprot:504946-Pelagomonas_calceolata.AAC.2